jgi:hypothetical protein
MIVKRNLFYINQFLHFEVNKTLKAQATHAAKKVNALFGQQYQQTLNELSLSSNETDRLLYHRLKEIRQKIDVNEEEFASECLHAYSLDYNEIHDRFQMYQTQNLTQMDEQFAQENQNRTSVRGVKIRGVYSDKAEAEERAKFVNTNVEPNIHAYVAQMGYWLAWDPDPDSIKDSQYHNEELNKLMKQYHENVVARNEFFEKRKQEQLEDAEKNAREVAKERLRQKLRERRAERAGNRTTKAD